MKRLLIILAVLVSLAMVTSVSAEEFYWGNNCAATSYNIYADGVLCQSVPGNVYAIEISEIENLPSMDNDISLTVTAVMPISGEGGHSDPVILPGKCIPDQTGIHATSE